MVRRRNFLVCFAFLSAAAPVILAGARKGRLQFTDFERLMHRVSEGWSRQDTELALSAFSEDAVYMEPPNEQFFEGHPQLRPYFAALKKGTFMIWHNLFFNESTQRGAGEYSFGEESDKLIDHGVAVVELKNGKIAAWREYQRKGPRSFEEFKAKDGKQWQWTIKQYP